MVSAADLFSEGLDGQLKRRFFPEEVRGQAHSLSPDVVVRVVREVQDAGDADTSRRWFVKYQVLESHQACQWHYPDMQGRTYEAEEQGNHSSECLLERGSVRATARRSGDALTPWQELQFQEHSNDPTFLVSSAVFQENFGTEQNWQRMIVRHKNNHTLLTDLLPAVREATIRCNSTFVTPKASLTGLHVMRLGSHVAQRTHQLKSCGRHSWTLA